MNIPLDFGTDEQQDDQPVETLVVAQSEQAVSIVSPSADEAGQSHLNFESLEL